MTKLNILYIHCFGSQVDPDGDKQVTLNPVMAPSAILGKYIGSHRFSHMEEALPLF